MNQTDQIYLEHFFSVLVSIEPIINALIEAGGTAYFVGGCVRDVVLEKPLKDFDIEVHGLQLDQLQAVLEKFGPVRLVGKQFGVLLIDGIDVDWALPRKDSSGRKPEVQIDPTMTIEQACKRRDITMNALALDVSKALKLVHENNQTKEALVQHILDPYGGLEDMKKNQIRAVDVSLFVEDPLRFFRVMQFAGRFDMQPDQELNELCARMPLHDQVRDVPLAVERVYDEFKKLLLKSSRPSIGFYWLEKIGRLKELLPELHALIGTLQPPEHHPEGDVFVHTMQALDCAARHLDYQESELGSADREKLVVLLGVLCHDLGKPATTTHDLKAYGHAQAGVKPARALLKRMTNDLQLIAFGEKLVAHHMEPFAFVRQKASLRAYKRLANKLPFPLTLRQLALVSRFDAAGRKAEGFDPLPAAENDYVRFITTAQKARVDRGPEKPILLGRHLIDEVEPGKKMGALLKKAYDIQIDEGIKDVEVLRARVLKKRT